MTEKCERTYSILIQFFPNGATKQELYEEIEKFKVILGLSQDEADKVVKEYLKTFGFVQPQQVTVSENSDPTWFDTKIKNYDKENEFLHWKRYKRYLIAVKHFRPKVVETMQKDIEHTLRLCANPAVPSVIKKGLVMGDVQSGKTSNYIGLINYALDLGYKQVILLAGLTENLRVQTQKRVDSGIIGVVPGVFHQGTEFIGINKLLPADQQTLHAIPMTNEKKDYGEAYAQAQNYIPSQLSESVIYVVKKNQKVLRTLLDRIVYVSKYDKNPAPVLIIDDECDNASLNTKSDTDPSQINSLIRQIVEASGTCTYIGYTATPFANIFADSDDEKIPDLFPQDFITLIEPSSEYYGATSMFFPYSEIDSEAKGQHSSEITLLKPTETNFFKTIHKKTDHFTSMAQSLKDAFLVFLLSNCVRTLRGDDIAPRSFLINISRFNNIQYEISERIKDYVKEVKDILETTDRIPLDCYIKYSIPKRLYDLWYGEDFSHSFPEQDCPNKTYSFQQIRDLLLSEINLFEVFVINMKSKKDPNQLDYNSEKYNIHGARAIVIGGLTLSRGITLEGLMTSYYNRHASAYDVLLQMARWFGYHPGFEDLVHVYMTQENIDCFCVARDATEEMKISFRRMAALNKTPREFGLMVRQSPESLSTSLLITARNKSKHAASKVCSINLSGAVVDSSKLFYSEKSNNINHKAIGRLLTSLKDNEIKKSVTKPDYFYFSDVSKDKIVTLLNEISIPKQNLTFNIDALTDFINHEKLLDKWTVTIAHGSKELINECPSLYPDGIKKIKRNCIVSEEEGLLKISGSHNQIAEPSLFSITLTNEEIQLANIKAQERMEKYNKDHPDKVAKTNPKPIAKDFLGQEHATPILFIYPIQPEITDYNGPAVIPSTIWGFGLGFPGSGNSLIAKYLLNKVAQQAEENSDEDEDDDEEDETIN